MPGSLRIAPSNRIWPIAEKRRIVELTLDVSASVQEIAKQHNLPPSTLSAWRALYRDGKLAGNALEKSAPTEAFFPVNITNVHAPLPMQINQMRAQIFLPCGTSLQIEAASFDWTALGRFLRRCENERCFDEPAAVDDEDLACRRNNRYEKRLYWAECNCTNRS